MAPIERAPFPPGRTEPCFCGSGQRFKHCCGSGTRAPAGLGLMPGFLSPEDCAALRAAADASASTRLQVVDLERSDTERVVYRPDERRVADRVALGEHQAVIDGWIRRALETVIAPSLGRGFRWYEQPRLLKYGSGGVYWYHADSDNPFDDGQTWRKTLDRDISLLLYLNEDFEGGALRFEHFDFELRPSAGLLVWFPSDVRYLHAALPVVSGTRYAVVSWASFRDEPRVMRAPPEDACPLED